MNNVKSHIKFNYRIYKEILTCQAHLFTFNLYFLLNRAQVYDSQHLEDKIHTNWPTTGKQSQWLTSVVIKMTW